GGGTRTLGELARERANPSAIAKGNSWGAYRKETAAALAWTRAVIKAEGLAADLRNKRTQRRLIELADEIAAASARGKPVAMAKQMMRALKVDDRLRNSGYDLSEEAALMFRRKLASGGTMAAAVKAAEDYLDIFKPGQFTHS